MKVELHIYIYILAIFCHCCGAALVLHVSSNAWRWLLNFLFNYFTVGKGRTASEAADLIYHAMVLMNVQNVSLDEVCAVLRSRFGTSGIEEKTSRPPKEKGLISS